MLMRKNTTCIVQMLQRVYLYKRSRFQTDFHIRSEVHSWHRDCGFAVLHAKYINCLSSCPSFSTPVFLHLNAFHYQSGNTTKTTQHPDPSIEPQVDLFHLYPNPALPLLFQRFYIPIQVLIRKWTKLISSLIPPSPNGFNCFISKTSLF